MSDVLWEYVALAGLVTAKIVSSSVRGIPGADNFMVSGGTFRGQLSW